MPQLFPSAPRRETHSVFGYARGIEKDNRMNIPEMIKYLCLKFYYLYKKDKFQSISDEYTISDNGSKVTRNCDDDWDWMDEGPYHFMQNNIESTNGAKYLYQFKIIRCSYNEQCMAFFVSFKKNGKEIERFMHFNDGQSESKKVDDNYKIAKRRKYRWGDVVKYKLDLDSKSLSVQINNGNWLCLTKLKCSKEITLQFGIFIETESDCIQLIDNELKYS